MSHRLTNAGAGVLAATLGVTAGDVVAALTRPATSPILAIGTQVIDLTPTPVKQLAIAEFGTADKFILIGSVGLATIGLAAVIGIAAGRLLWAGLALVGAMAAIAGVTALRMPGGSVRDVLPALVTGVVAIGALAVLAHAHRSHPPSSDRPTSGSSRRRLIAAVVLVFAAAGLEGSARTIVRRRTKPSDFVLPMPTSPAGSFPAGVAVPGVTPFRTPSRTFYRVDTRLTVPTVDVDEWALRVDGDVDRDVSIGFDELAGMPTMERDITLTCVSNDVGGRYLGGARWLGVPLSDVLERAGIRSTTADQILSTDVDGMTISTPLSVALDGRDSMIAIGMNGRPLPREHGFPARMIVPGLYGFVGAAKWITRMTLTTYEAQDAYWTKRGWAVDAPIKPSSRIDTPPPLADVSAGDVLIGGVAWAQQAGGVAEVEVRIDDGPWQKATLGPSAGDDYWRQWYLKWPATRGQHTLASRATTGAGRAQSSRRESPFPSGSSGIQQIVVTVS